MASWSFAAILAARQAKARVCRARLSLALNRVTAAAGATLEAGTAAEFSVVEAFKIAGDQSVEEARASCDAAWRDCAGLEVLERREATRRRARRSRSEAREADERNRMLATLRP